jgi:hypothetical protein
MQSQPARRRRPREGRRTRTGEGDNQTERDGERASKQAPTVFAVSTTVSFKELLQLSIP